MLDGAADLLLERQEERRHDTDLPEPRIRVQCASRLAELDAHAEAWDRLAYFAPQRAPMLSHAWVSSYLEHLLKPGESWFCLLAYAGPDLLGVLPVVSSSGRSVLARGKLCHAPDDLDVWTGDMLAANGRGREVAAALLDEFTRLRPDYAALRLNKLPPGSQSPHIIEDGFGGRRVLGEPAGQGAFLRIGGSHKDYIKSLSANFKSNLKRANKRLAGLGGVETHFLTGEAPSGEHMRLFFDLEASGWKGRAGSAILSCERHTAFFSTLVRRLRARGMLEWHLLQAGGKLIAGHLAVRTHNKLTIWKLAYDEQLSQCAPGNMLFERLVHRSYAEGGVDEIDLVSDFAWYSKWRMERRPYRNLIISPPELTPYLGNLAALKARAGLRRLKEEVKKSPALSAAAYRVRDLARRIGR